MIIYDLFYRQTIMRRIGDIGKLWDKSDLEEYPLGSVLHLLDDNFLMDKPIKFTPDVNGWSLTRKPQVKYMHHVSELVESSSNVVPYAERFILPTQGVKTTLTNYRRRNLRWIRPAPELEDLPHRSNVQAVVTYNSLYRARVFGILRNFRRFNYVWANVVNTLVQMPDRKHFIPLTITNQTFDRNMFLRTFEKYTKATIKYPEDMHYIFMVHFLGFIYSQKTESVFEYIPERMWKNINFVITAGNNMVIYNLQHLKDWNGDTDTLMIRIIKQINKLAETGVVAPVSDFSDVPAEIETTIDESLPTEEEYEDEQEESTPQQYTYMPTKPIVTETVPDKEPTRPKEKTEPKKVTPIKSTPTLAPEPKAKSPVPKLVPVPTIAPEPKRSTAPNPLQLPKIIRPLVAESITSKKTEQSKKEIDQLIDFEPHIIEIDPKWLEVEAKEDKLNAPVFTEAIEKKEQIKFNKTFVTDIDTASKEIIDNTKGLTTAQVKKVYKVAEEFKTIQVGNTTVEKLLNSTIDDTISSNDLDFLKDKVMDPSMLKSSVKNFEHEYMTKAFEKDLVSGLVSFNKQGMFLTDIKKENITDSLNSFEKYTVKYTDTALKKHTIKFTLPKIDERGFCFINGTFKTLKKQRITNPICKVSPTRVALNSDFNKYLIERNTAVARSFINYVDTLFAKATPEQELKLSFDKINYQKQTLPYEYTSLASKYNKIEFGRVGLSLSLDYTTRFEDVYGNIEQKECEDWESDLKAVYIGGRDNNDGTNYCCFLDLTGKLTIMDTVNGVKIESTTLIDLFAEILQQEPSSFSEWINFKLLNKTVPLIFALGYRFGLTEMLKYTKCKYQIYDAGKRFDYSPSDVVVRFKDKRLVIPRSPLIHSLLFAGLNNYDLRKIEMDAMDGKDVYFDLLQSKKMSIHNLKGIDGFFDMFIDPITRDVLHQMGEPTNTKDLLIRCVQLLSTEDHEDPASSTNFRFRSYERMNAAVYKILTKSFQTYKHRASGATSKFSIPEYETQQAIMEDQLMENVDMINPIHDIKYQHAFSHAGFGGRATETFMIDDRQFSGRWCWYYI